MNAYQNAINLKYGRIMVVNHDVKNNKNGMIINSNVDSIYKSINHYISNPSLIKKHGFARIKSEGLLSNHKHWAGPPELPYPPYFFFVFPTQKFLGKLEIRHKNSG